MKGLTHFSEISSRHPHVDQMLQLRLRAWLAEAHQTVLCQNKSNQIYMNNGQVYKLYKEHDSRGQQVALTTARNNTIIKSDHLCLIYYNTRI